MHIRIRKSDAGKNEMVAFLDRVISVWEPQLKSIVLDSLDSEPPSSIYLGIGCYLECSATALTIFHGDREIVVR